MMQITAFNLLLCVTACCTAFSISTVRVSPQYSTMAIHRSLIFNSASNSNNNIKNEHVSRKRRDDKKDYLLELLGTVPSNQKSSSKLTSEILSTVNELELTCPTKDNEVLSSLSGNWELVYTTQDETSAEMKKNGPFRTWINPLENQSYSNNPAGGSGRSNPILPQNIQDRLERMGIVVPQPSRTNNDSVRSSQAIDLKQSRVRNVVKFGIPAPSLSLFQSIDDGDDTNNRLRQANIVVDVRFKPNKFDPRRVDVKFESCRVSVKKSPIDITFPLGLIGPTGWLRTGYIDDTIRITRGHKGSVFILTRTTTVRKA